MTGTRHDPMPKLCRHDDPSWCNEECEEKTRKFDEWMRRQLKGQPVTEKLTDRLRFLRRTAKFKYAKDQFYMVGNVMHEGADQIERLTAAVSAARSYILEHGDERSFAPIIEQLERALDFEPLPDNLSNASTRKTDSCKS